MSLPPLLDDYRHALLTEVVFGPRREIALMVEVLQWENQNGRPGPRVRVRFGGVSNLNAMRSFFAANHQPCSELADLRYSRTKAPKTGCLFVEIAFERVDAVACIECSSLAVTEER